MEVFYLTAEQMAVLFGFMLAGFILRKSGAVSDGAHTALSRTATFVFMPALVLSALAENCDAQSFAENAPLILYGAGLLAFALAIGYIFSRLLFIKEKDGGGYERNIYKYAFAIANFGYMGNVIVLGVWGGEMLYKYTMFTLPLQIAVYSWGLFVLIPRGEGKGVKGMLKGLLNPPMIAMAAGFVLGLSGAGKHLPGFVSSMLSGAGGCVGPVCMLVAGMIIGGYKAKEILTGYRIYVVTAARLIAIPALIVLALKLFGAPSDVVSLALVAFATPIGLNVIVFPSAYGADTKPGAGMVLLSNVLAVATIPLMYLVFAVLT